MADDRENSSDDEPEDGAEERSSDDAEADAAEDAADGGSADDASSDDDADEASASPEESDDDAGASEREDGPSDDADEAASGGSTATKGSKSWTSKLWLALPVLMIVEFYMYGHNGRLEICVGKEGDTDFSLVGQERTDENRWKFPRCETRNNLGLRSEREIKVEEGTKVACRGATIFRHQGEGKACIAGEKGWIHRVEGHFVPPWEPAYYQHLFWFLQ